MREENNFSFFFSRCEDEQLPSPEELMPLSQSLISPDLALAFQIHIPINHNRVAKNLVTISDQQPPPPDYGSGAGPGGGMDEPARTLKRPRLVWTPQLHKRFVDAVAHLGIKNAVPKTIMQMMNVDGLTRENVASHLQKYRLYLKRVQGISGNHAGVGHDSATDRLFASSPVPAHFLNQGPIISSDNLMQSFVPPPATAAAIHRMQPPQYHQTPVGYFGGPPPSGKQFEQSYSNIYIQQPIQHRMGVAMQNSAGAVYAENLGSGTRNGEKKVLSLFPNGED